MKKLVLLLVLTLCACVVFGATTTKKSAPAPKKSAPAATAKKAPGPRGMGMPGLSDPNIQKQLNLTADQKKKLAAIDKKYQPKLDAAAKNMPRPKMNGNKPDMSKKPTQAEMDKMRKSFEAMGKLRKEYVTECEKVLTKAQKTKYDQIKQKRFEEMAKKFGMPTGRVMGGPGGPGAPKQTQPVKPKTSKK
ncbi:MAG: Spy/CpxP family protein refolding chaperone [Abditibacteriota bacterium]|nr:Spy/CpxP family protein refolding chaperone [Abditibacteriota bacterium]